MNKTIIAGLLYSMGTALGAGAEVGGGNIHARVEITIGGIEEVTLPEQTYRSLKQSLETSRELELDQKKLLLIRKTLDENGSQGVLMMSQEGELLHLSPQSAK